MIFLKIVGIFLIFYYVSTIPIPNGIPDDWEKYIDPEMLEEYRGKSFHDSYSPTNFQGDIKGVEKKLMQNELKSILNNFATEKSKRWENGTVPYVLGDLFKDPDYEQERYRIELAMELMGSSTDKCVNFVPRKDQRDYIEIVRGLSCSSAVGRQGGKQTVSLMVGCLEKIGSIQHELMHVLGFYHEIARSDRDEYIWINWDNIIESYQNDFLIPTDVTTFGLPYDYESVTHYGYNAFAIDGLKPTIVPKIPGGKRIGQNSGLSFLDSVKIRKAYCVDAEELKATAPTFSTSLPVPTTTEIASGFFAGESLCLPQMARCQADGSWGSCCSGFCLKQAIQAYGQCSGSPLHLPPTPQPIVASDASVGLFAAGSLCLPRLARCQADGSWGNCCSGFCLKQAIQPYGQCT